MWEQRARRVCQEVVALAGAGAAVSGSTAQIADRLVISVNTVQDHLKSIFAKVGVRSRGGLVARLRPGGTGDAAAT